METKEIREIKELLTIEKLRQYRRECWIQDTLDAIDRMMRGK